MAQSKAREWGERIPIGVIYRKERMTFEERLPGLRKGPLVKQALDPKQVEKLLDEFIGGTEEANARGTPTG